MPTQLLKKQWADGQPSIELGRRYRKAILEAGGILAPP